MDLLTEDELEAMDLSGKLANKLGKIIRQNGTKEQQDYDWQEAAMRIHALQHTIMAQAASRAYPERFRLLGGWNEDQMTKEDEKPITDFILELEAGQTGYRGEEELVSLYAVNMEGVATYEHTETVEDTVWPTKSGPCPCYICTSLRAGVRYD